MFKKWVKNFFIMSFSFLALIGIFNYFINPYSLYNNILHFDKVKQKIRLLKAVKIREIKPASIILGTSRAETAFNPNNPYFLQPAYNAANSGASMYEEMKYFKYALKQGNLKQVLLVVDYIMFDSFEKKHVKEFDKYFNYSFIDKYKYLFSFQTLKDSIKTITAKKNVEYIPYLDNGQRKHNYKLKYIMKRGGYYKVVHSNLKNYYKRYLPEYKYQDSKYNSFKDFNEIVKLSYLNNIKLTIIFGPSHILQWESLDKYIGYNNWLKWKKDIVLDVNYLAQKYQKKPFRIVDFAIYNKWTSEKIPKNPTKIVKYYWEASHYTNKLGDLVLHYLMYNTPKGLGVEVNKNNIDIHLEQLKKDRKIYLKRLKD